MRRPSAGIVFGLVATFLAAVACSGRGAGTGTPGLPPDCDRFVTKYESCLKATIPSLPALAKQRSSQTRMALEEEARRATSANDGHCHRGRKLRVAMRDERRLPHSPTDAPTT